MQGIDRRSRDQKTPLMCAAAAANSDMTWELVQQAFVLSQIWFSWSFRASTVLDQPIQDGSLYSTIFSSIGLSELVGQSLNMVSTDIGQ